MQDVTVIDATVGQLQVPHDDGEVSFMVLIREAFHSAFEPLVRGQNIWNILVYVQHVVVVFVPPESTDFAWQRILSSVDTGQQHAVSSKTSDWHLAAR